MFAQHLYIIGLTMQLTKHPLRVYNVGEVIAMKKLAELRRSRHISQEQVARDLGIALRSYQNYEYGQREPNL
jgi:DNA-binding XRE family transcriptional regulator